MSADFVLLTVIIIEFNINISIAKLHSNFSLQQSNCMVPYGLNYIVVISDKIKAASDR